MPLKSDKGKDSFSASAPSAFIQRNTALDHYGKAAGFRAVSRAQERGIHANVTMIGQ